MVRGVLMEPLRVRAHTFAAALLCGTVLSACHQESAEDSRPYVARVTAAHQDDLPTSNVDPAVMNSVKSIAASNVIYASILGKPVTGFLARPTGSQTYPGVMLIHEWWGLNENMRRQAEMLAAEGYAVLAVDLYGGQTARTPDAAKALMSAAMAHPAPIEDNLRQAYEFLKKRGSGKIGVVGWCFGGGWALKTALNMAEKINALTIYYGQLVQDRKALATLKMPILGIFAEQDPTVPLREVNQFSTTLKSLGKNAVIRIYPNVDHAFANPSGEHYSPRAAADAWGVTLAFLNKSLR